MPSIESDLPQSLTNKQKLALMMRANGLSDQQIANRMDITRESANRLIARAKQREREFHAAMEKFKAEE